MQCLTTSVCVLSFLVMSDSVTPQTVQPTRLRCPWDSPGKNTGVGCHCLLQGWNPRLESPALAGGFSTTVPPRKPHLQHTYN